jgi:hypothetical protein
LLYSSPRRTTDITIVTVAPVQDWGVTYGVPGLVDKTAAAAAALNVALTREAGNGMRDGLKGTDGGNYKWSVAEFFAVGCTLVLVVYPAA